MTASTRTIVTRVAAEDKGTLQTFGQILATAGIPFNDLDLVMGLDALRQLLADIPASRDHDPVIGPPGLMEGTDEFGDVWADREEKNLVIYLDTRGALRHDDPATPVDGHQSALRVGNPARQNKQ